MSMGIELSDLPVAYQKQVLEKIARQEKNRAALPCPAQDGTAGRKYHNSPAQRVDAQGNILRFDSKKEAARFDVLAAMEQSGQISDLRMQADFTLQEAYTDTSGRRVRAIRYRADFTYFTGTGAARKLVVEDVKSSATRTREYFIKKKMLKERFGIDVQEVCNAEGDRD